MGKAYGERPSGLHQPRRVKDKATHLRRAYHECAMRLVCAYEMSRDLTIARALRASHRRSTNDTMMHAKKIHLPICETSGAVSQRCAARQRRGKGREADGP